MSLPVKGRHVVYRVLDEWLEPLYIGVTSDFPARMKAHAKKPWWPQMELANWVFYPTRKDAEWAEMMAIETENPRYNIARFSPYVDEIATAMGDPRAADLREAVEF